MCQSSVSKGPQGLVDTIALITESISPSISIFRSPSLLIFAIESPYILIAPNGISLLCEEAV